MIMSITYFFSNLTRPLPVSGWKHSAKFQLNFPIDRNMVAGDDYLLPTIILSFPLLSPMSYPQAEAAPVGFEINPLKVTDVSCLLSAPFTLTHPVGEQIIIIPFTLPLVFVNGWTIIKRRRGQESRGQLRFTL